MTERLNISPSVFGPHAWNFIDMAAASANDKLDIDETEGFNNFLQSLKHVTPCETCRMHTAEYEEQHPIQFRKRKDIQMWILGLKNAINERLGKPQISFEEYIEHVKKISMGTPPPPNNTTNTFVVAGVIAFLALLVFIYAFYPK